MMWILLATVGYLAGALTLIADKFLLSSRRLSRPAGYAFLTAVFSLFASVFTWFEPATLDWSVRALSMVSGVCFVYGLLFLYSALREHPVSTVAPLVGIATALVTLAPSLLVAAFLGIGSRDFLLGLLSFGLFVIGGFLVAFDLPIRREFSVHWRNIVLAGGLMALSYLLLKFGYAVSHLPFVGSIVWSRLGFFLGGMSLFAIPRFRVEIIETFRDMFRRGDRRSGMTTSVIFVGNKALGGISVILVNWAIFLGPVGVVQAMDGVRFAFVFLLARLLTKPFPEIFREKLLFWDWMQKWLALGFLALAFWVALQISVDGLPLLS